MIYPGEERENLEELLKKVKDRIQILNLVEDKLIKMRELAEIAVDKDLSQTKKNEIKKQLKKLEEQIRFLENQNRN